jgi:predicted GIY-YIG superfamily endonuclease
MVEGNQPRRGLDPSAEILQFLRAEASVRERLPMQKPKRFHVYIMTNRPRSHVLYTGVTGHLSRRVFEHKNKLVPGFTGRYNLTRLAYYECFFYPDAAIDRERKK